MNVLIDTHIFLWALAEPKRLNAFHKQELVSPANRVWLSSISIAELMIKSSLGKLQIDFDPVEQAETMGLDLLDFTAEDAGRLGDLPLHHRDPFDRMLIAQSLSKNLCIMTEDVKFSAYECALINPS
jgi:PIN domain nuclease of toxin-antitoxin system